MTGHDTWPLFFVLMIIALYSPFLVGATIPVNPICHHIPHLAGIPLGDQTGIIIKTGLITIKDHPYVFNPSVISLDDGYLMTFRKNIYQDRRTARISQVHIGHTRFDKNFIQCTPAEFYPLPRYDRPHDGRIFSCSNRLFLLYAYWENKTAMNMALGEITPLGKVLSHQKLYYTSPGRIQRKGEKNWTPFEYIDKKGDSHLLLVYSFNPFEIITLDDRGTVSRMPDITPSRIPGMDYWEATWGTIRGGTPALPVNDVYLTFFHSAFKNPRDKDKYVYVCGALTFEKKPPFRPRSISPYPILCKDCYQYKIEGDCPPLRKVLSKALFPCGFVYAHENGRDCIHLVCGENDRAIRVITCDREKLLAHLVPINTDKKPI